MYNGDKMLKINANKKVEGVDINAIAKQICLEQEQLCDKELNLVFISQKRMRELNLQFRGKNEPTDVLSFNLNEPEILGEVYICPAYLRAEGRHTVEEIVRMIVHGVLHLAGFDHKKKFNENDIIEEEIFVLQEKILDKIMASL